MVARGVKRCTAGRLGRVVLVAGLVAGAAAPAARAATVANTHDAGVPGVPTYTAAAGEINHLAVGGNGASVLFSDAAPIIAPIPTAVPPAVPAINDCTAAATTASCPLAAVAIAL